MPNIYLALGALILGLGVIAGAFGAHALKSSLEPKYLEVFETAVRYQVYHGFGLIIVALTTKTFNSINVRYIGGLMLSGTIVFSGSLYVVALTDLKWFGVVTPIGGFCLIVSWLTLFWRAMRSR